MNAGQPRKPEARRPRVVRWLAWMVTQWHLVERSHGHGFGETGRLVLAKRNPTCPLCPPFK